MTRAVYILYFIIQCYIRDALSREVLNDTLIDNGVNLAPDVNNTILRAGHRTYDCKDFNKAYVCIMKCLELGYHIAESNKKCKCTCHKDYVKSKYFPGVKPGWQLPTTSLPPWAVQGGGTKIDLSYELDETTAASSGETKSDINDSSGVETAASVNDAPAEVGPNDDPPTDAAPADDEQATDPPTEDGPATDPPTDDAPADDPPVDDVPAEDAPAEDAPAEDAPAEDAPE